jgi:hypothetical protein
MGAGKENFGFKNCVHTTTLNTKSTGRLTSLMLWESLVLVSYVLYVSSSRLM